MFRPPSVAPRRPPIAASVTGGERAVERVRNAGERRVVTHAAARRAASATQGIHTVRTRAVGALAARRRGVLAAANRRLLSAYPARCNRTTSFSLATSPPT